MSAEPDTFRGAVRQFLKQHLPDHLARKGQLGLEFTKQEFVDWQKLLFAHGWFAGSWPQAHGGGGWSLEQQLCFVQETAIAGAPVIAPYVDMIGPVICSFGSELQRARYLPGILGSDTWWCQGYSEPNAGSDLASLKTTATRDGDHFIVNGTKIWTTEAHWSDMMHCLARSGRNSKPQADISFLLIDMRLPGVSVRPITMIDGQHRTNQVFLDNVRVPADCLVGREGEGWSIAKFLLTQERVLIAETGTRIRLFAKIEALLARLDAVPEIKLPLLHKLAKVRLDLFTLCALERSYVKYWSNGGARTGPEASVLKVRSTEVLQEMTELALEIGGPLGAAHNPRDLHRQPDEHFGPAELSSLMTHQYLYGRCWSIFGGTNEIQRNLIARSLLADTQ